MNIFIPYGTVVAYAAEIDPQTYKSENSWFGHMRNNTGWLLCDGAQVMESVFPNLFKVIRYTYGGTKGSGKFNLPDYRGYFLRALATNGSIDTGFDSRTDCSTGLANNGIGSIEQCMVQKHEHTYTDYPGTALSI